MKIIDLLNKIANGEELPKKIKINDIIYYSQIYHCSVSTFYVADNEDLWLDNCKTDDEIEIIEEPKKIENNLKKMLIPSIQFNLNYIDTNDKEVVIKEMNKTIQDLYDRTLDLNTQINEIIDKINEIIDKINEVDSNE